MVEEFVVNREDGIIFKVHVPKYGGLQARQNGSVYDGGRVGKVD